MAKNEQPIFTRDPVIAQAAISVANANRDGTGTIVSVLDGGTDGVRVNQIEVKAEATTTAGMIRLFISLDNGATWDLWREIPVTAIVPSGTVESFSALVDLTAAGQVPLDLATDQVELGAATENAEVFNVFARGGALAA